MKINIFLFSKLNFINKINLRIKIIGEINKYIFGLKIIYMIIFYKIKIKIIKNIFFKFLKKNNFRILLIYISNFFYKNNYIY